MIPGMAGPPFPENAVEGSLVAIASTENPGVPLAVGYALVDISKIKNVVGEKGKAVETVHWYGDEIWKIGGSLEPPETKQLFGDLEEVTESVQKLELGGNEGTGETQEEVSEEKTAEASDADRLAQHQLGVKGGHLRSHLLFAYSFTFTNSLISS